MPSREKIQKKAGSMLEYSYDDLLIRIRAHIDKTYDGVSNFLKHEDYRKCGFPEGQKEKAKMFTYLALPKADNDGRTRRIKSFPVLEKLYRGLLGVEIVNEIKVERKQVITANSAVIEGLDEAVELLKKQPKLEKTE